MKIIYVITIIFLFACTNKKVNEKDKFTININSNDLVMIESFDAHKQKLLTATFEEIEKNKNHPFVKDYFRLLTDSSVVHFGSFKGVKHGAENMEITGFSVYIVPYRDDSHYFTYKLYNDTLGRLIEFQLIFGFNQDYTLKEIGYFVQINELFDGNKERFKTFFEVYDTTMRVEKLFPDSIPEIYKKVWSKKK